MEQKRKLLPNARSGNLQKQILLDSFCGALNLYQLTGCFFVYKSNMDLKQWIGIIAGLLTSISMLPQLIKIIKEKKAKEISLKMLIVLTTGNVLWAVYGLMREDWPIIVTNCISITINSITAIYRIRYKDR
jgi:MtN3 and saliva related transmembrane protein